METQQPGMSVDIQSDLHYLIAAINKSNIVGTDILELDKNVQIPLMQTISEKNTPKILVTKLKSQNATVTEIPEEDIIGNPIGMLQELCMIRKWMPPDYGTEQEEGLPHERLFTISCTVGVFREYGVGRSKKLAKRQAAHKMAQKILTIPAEDDLKINFEEDEEVVDRFANHKANKGSAIFSNASRKISLFHKNLKSLSGSKVELLKTMSIDNTTVDPIKFIRDLTNENKIEITYVNIEEKSYSDKFQCLIQLSTLPVAVCPGDGTTIHEAQRKAALNVMKYIKLLSK